jgi:hypothetical protein
MLSKQLWALGPPCDPTIGYGGDAAGMSAASQAKRMWKADLKVVALERSPYTSLIADGHPEFRLALTKPACR